MSGVVHTDSFDGPYELSMVDIYALDTDQVITSPLKARVSLSVSTRGQSNPYRIVIISDAQDAHVADAFLPREADQETQALAAQWLLDLCCVRYGIEGVLFKHSPFNVIYR